MQRESENILCVFMYDDDINFSIFVISFFFRPLFGPRARAAPKNNDNTHERGRECALGLGCGIAFHASATSITRSSGELRSVESRTRNIKHFHLS
jgi:hypothetical protein